MQQRSWETTEKRTIRRLVSSISKAIMSHDGSVILTAYDTRDPKFCTFEDTPDYPLRVNGAKFEEFIDALVSESNAGRLKIDKTDIRVDFVRRDVAVVTGLENVQTIRHGKRTKSRSRFTIVLWKKRNKWKVIHEHFTRI